MKMGIDTNKIQRIFNYLYNPTKPLTKADGAFVFCRDDPLVAQRVAELFNEDLIDYVVFTGGIGKDSGYLTNLKLSEAKWQAALLHILYGISKDKIYVESNSKNGVDNSNFGIDTITKNNLSHQKLIIVIHPTQLKRVYKVHQILAKRKNFKATYQLTGTNYFFDPKKNIDQQEAVTELLKLADWPSQGLLVPQSDLPNELVTYARKLKTK